jgi:nitroreductase
MDAYRAIVDKRDQRAFLPRPIPEETLRRILQAGRMTGSSKNREPNRFVVVRERAGVAAIAALGAHARWVASAAAVVVTVQTERHEFDHRLRLHRPCSPGTAEERRPPPPASRRANAP